MRVLGIVALGATLAACAPAGNTICSKVRKSFAKLALIGRKGSNSRRLVELGLKVKK